MKKVAKIVLTVVALCVLVAGVFFAATAIRYTQMRSVTVVGESMQPTYMPATRVRIDTTKTPDFYDVVIFYYVPDLSVNPASDYNGAVGFFRCMPLFGKAITDNYDNRYALYIKRVVGLGGDVVELRSVTEKGVNFVYLYRNGVKVDESFVMLDSAKRDSATAAYARQTEGVHWVDAVAPYTVPQGCLYLLGDNRSHSDDSRIFEFGALPQEYVVGLAK